MRDYTPEQQKASVKLKSNGVLIKLIKFDDTPADTNKPWASGVSNRDSAGASTCVYALRAHPGSSDFKTGTQFIAEDLLKTLEAVYIAEVGEDDKESLDQYHVVEDDREHFGIKFVRRFKPGNVTILYYIGVAK